MRSSQTLPHLLLGRLEAVSREVDGLELGDGVALLARLHRIEGAHFRFVAQTVLSRDQTNEPTVSDDTKT